MPDIQLRFHRDMLVLSSPIAPVLARQGFELDGDVEYATLMEPEAVEDALRLNLMAGVQCLVTETAGMTPARLAHRGMAERLPELARAAVACAAKLRPQHVLVGARAVRSAARRVQQSVAQREPRPVRSRGARLRGAFP